MEIMKRLLYVVLILLFCMFSFAGCRPANPEIIESIKLSGISEDEYSQISSSGMVEVTHIEDYKKLLVSIKMTNSKNAIERIISIPDLFVINRYDRIRVINAGGTERNNIRKEDTAESTEYVIFDSSGLSEENIRKIFSKSEVYIAYRLKNSNLAEKSISIGDVLVVN